MKYKKLNGVKTYCPTSGNDLMEYAMDHQKILVAVNALKILLATDDSRKIINRNLGYPDGYGAVMGLKRKGIKEVVKIPGCELWLDIVRRYYKEKTFYLVGGQQKIIETTVAQLQNEFPGIHISGFRNGFMQTPQENSALIDDIAQKKADIVFVAMGSPKQELLMEQMHQKHPALYQGLGGSFDVYTGNVARAPKWWVSNRLEWAYRLMRQPARIRSQIHLVRYIYMLEMNRL